MSHVVKTLLLVFVIVILAGCTTTKLIPVPYMPSPPTELMKDPKDLSPIKPRQEVPVVNEEVPSVST